MARPTDYSEEKLEQAKYYLEHWEDEGIGDSVPSIEGLACFLGTHKDTIYEWEKHEDRQEFSDIVKQLRNLKSKTLQDRGLTNKYNASIAKLLLGHEGYREKQEIDHTTQGDKINDTSKVALIAEEVAKKLKENNT